MENTAQNKNESMELKLYNQGGEEVGSVKLPNAVFGVKMNTDVVHEVIVANLANSRPPVAHAKDRSEVRGGGRKPWRQKGTGRARHSSIRSPIWRTGGVTFGPRSTDNYSKKVNKKTKRSALLMALSSKVTDKEILMLDKLQLDGAKTKEANIVLDALVPKLENYNDKKGGKGGKKKDSILIITPKKDRALERAVNNIPHAGVLAADSLNAREVLAKKYIIVCQDAVGVIEKTYNA